MKLSVVAIILLLACVGLGVGLVVENQHHAAEKQDLDAKILNLTNSVNTLEGKLAEQNTVNQALETNLASVRSDFSNEVAQFNSATNDLASLSAHLEETKTAAAAAAAAASDRIAQQDKKISDLQAENQSLDKAAGDLRATITNLDAQIQDTQQKLAASEGDKKVLVSELHQLQTDKADLEKKFNNLVALKEQVRKVKDELALERKLDWIRRGTYDSIKIKGAELLTRMHNPPAAPAKNGMMEVELRQSGGVYILSPDSTNSTGK